MTHYLYWLIFYSSDSPLFASQSLLLLAFSVSILWLSSFSHSCWLLFDFRPIGFSLTSLLPLAFLSVSHSCGLLFDFRPIGFSLTSLLPVAFLSVSDYCGLLFDFRPIGFSLTYLLPVALRLFLSLTPVGYS